MLEILYLLETMNFTGNKLSPRETKWRGTFKKYINRDENPTEKVRNVTFMETGKIAFSFNRQVFDVVLRKLSSVL